MIGLLFGKPAILLAAAVAMVVLYGYAFHRGQQAVLMRLQAERVEVLKDGREIDRKVLEADDDALCELLGGCAAGSFGVPDAKCDGAL